MENPSITIEPLLQEKILLYQDLIAVLEQERQTLMSTQVEALWQLSDAKNALTGKIEAVRGRILSALEAAGIRYGMPAAAFKLSEVLALLPGDAARRLRNLELTLIQLKGEVRTRVEENKGFVGEYLRILDELMGVITDCGQAQNGYGNPLRKASPGQTNLLLHKEV